MVNEEAKVEAHLEKTCLLDPELSGFDPPAPILCFVFAGVVQANSFMQFKQSVPLDTLRFMPFVSLVY